jgi:hypothetical protein
MERFFKVLFHWRVRVDGAAAFSLYDCLVGGDLERSAVESEYSSIFETTQLIEIGRTSRLAV